MIPVRVIWAKIIRMQLLLTCCIGCLLLIGVFFIYSAGFNTQLQATGSFYQKQIVWIILGSAVYLFMALLDYDRLGSWGGWLYAVGLLLLLLVLFFGVRVYGAARWLDLGGLRIQPSEFAKLFTLIMLARYLSMPGRNMESRKTLAGALLIMGVPFILILQEPDLGTSMMLIPMTCAMLFVSGVPVKYLVVLALVGLLCLPLGWWVLDDYQQERILVFLDASRDPLGAGWNKIQSEIAVGSGGLMGKGFLQGTQNILGFLPRTVAPTDFIFSVIAEETGFMGSALVLTLYGLLCLGALRAAMLARDRFGRLIVMGVCTLIFCHVFVNIAMTVGLMPITGLPLPLISYGGSFLLTTMAALGMIQSVYIRRYRD